LRVGVDRFAKGARDREVNPLIETVLRVCLEGVVYRVAGVVSVTIACEALIGASGLGYAAQAVRLGLAAEVDRTQSGVGDRDAGSRSMLSFHRTAEPVCCEIAKTRIDEALLRRSIETDRNPRTRGKGGIRQQARVCAGRVQDAEIKEALEEPVCVDTLGRSENRLPVSARIPCDSKRWLQFVPIGNKQRPIIRH